MSTQRSKKYQIKAFSLHFPIAAIITCTSTLAILVYFSPVLVDSDILRSAVGDISYLPYYVASGAATTLYLTVLSFDNEEEDQNESSEDESESTDRTKLALLRSDFDAIADLYSPVVLIGTLVVVGGLVSVYATTHGLPYLGIFIAFIMPYTELWLMNHSYAYFTPSAWLFLIAMAMLVPMILLGVVFTNILRVVVKFSSRLKQLSEFLFQNISKFRTKIRVPNLSEIVRMTNRDLR